MKNVLIVFGGKSYEHDISVVTASQIFNKTKSENFKLIPLYVSRENKMFLYESKEFSIKDFASETCVENKKQFKEVVFVSSEKNRLFKKSRIGLKECLIVDSAIIACHGGIGENGKLVAIFEEMGIRCSSGNFDALAICMNKFLFKQTMKGLKIPVVAGFKITKEDYNNEELKNKLFLRLKLMKYPVVLKPNSGGSSIGLFVVNSWDEFDEKVKECFSFDREVIIEKFVANAKEFNIAVVGMSENFVVSEIDEPLKNSEVLTFADKYLSGAKSAKGSKNSMATQKRKFPADIDEELADKLKFFAGKIFKEIGLCGVVRIDFLWNVENNKLYVCEVNSVPGSLAYYFFSNNKIVVNDLIEKLIKASDDNYLNKQNFNKEFVTHILK